MIREVNSCCYEFRVVLSLPLWIAAAAITVSSFTFYLTVSC
jgi:hypothetical protein